jgi:hypothetical protein
VPLVERRQGRRAYFAVGGPDVEPPEWTRYAPPYQEIRPPSARQRRQFYQILASELWHQKQNELSQGLDARGVPLAPVKLPRKGKSDWHRRPYRKGSGPPLMPYRIDSRTRNLLRVRSNDRQAVVYWAAKRAPGAKLTWPEILVAHAEGLVRGAPARNVIGISPDGLRLATERAIKRYRIGSGPRPIDLPRTTRWDATRREARKAEAGGDPFDVRFQRVSILERVGRTVMRLFRRPAPPLPEGAEPLPEMVPVGETRLYRLGTRWLVIRGRRAWSVTSDGVASRRSLAALRGQAWRRVDPASAEVPPAVRAFWRRVDRGGET